MDEEHNQEEKKEEQAPADFDARLAQCEKERDEFIGLARVLKADFANAKKDQEREIARVIRFANEELLLKLLPIIDSFDLAIKHIPKDAHENSWVAGIEKIRQQLDAVLRQVGVSEVETRDTPLDAHAHEPVMHEESDGPEDVIMEELQKGYKLYDKIIRPAKVKVTKKKEN